MAATIVNYLLVININEARIKEVRFTKECNIQILLVMKISQ